MALCEEDRDLVEAFRDYVEGIQTADDRYGAATRHDRDDESTLVLRFNAGPSCWFEVAVYPSVPQVRIAFLTSDHSISEEVEQAIEESGNTMEQFVGAAFAEAGLDWREPPVEHYLEADEFFYFATPLVDEEFEQLVDLDRNDVRDKTVRMLEGYLIAFGPAIEEDEGDYEDE